MGIITLTTDFGSRDSYVAQMKGVIKSLSPQAEIIDLSHDIAPYDIFSAARVVAEACIQFPANTTHVVVVDPGVGSDRRRLLLRGKVSCPFSGGSKSQNFIGPDNGVLTLALPRDSWDQVVSLDQPQQFPEQPAARTFDGRNFFAPAAAYLDSGRDLKNLGTLLTPKTLEFPIVELHYPVPRRIGERFIEGEIVGFDNYGNAQTNLSRSDVGELTARFFLIRELGKREKQELPLVEHFSKLEIGAAGVLFNSSGFLEIISNRSSARTQLDLHMRARVLVEH